MSLTKEIAEQENHRTTADRMELHLWKEGSFMRAYDWSAFLACRPDLTMVLLLLPVHRRDGSVVHLEDKLKNANL